MRIRRMQKSLKERGAKMARLELSSLEELDAFEDEERAVAAVEKERDVTQRREEEERAAQAASHSHELIPLEDYPGLLWADLGFDDGTFEPLPQHW
jgi:hypothetical protein